MAKRLTLTLVCTAGCALTAPAQAVPKSAFDHQMTWNCPGKKTEYPDGRERYSQLDKASDWYKRTSKYLSLDAPYFQRLVADAYYTHLLAEVMHGRFDESAKKRFPE